MATRVSGVRCGTLRGSHALGDALCGSCTHSLCAVVRSASGRRRHALAFGELPVLQGV